MIIGSSPVLLLFCQGERFDPSFFRPGKYRDTPEREDEAECHAKITGKLAGTDTRVLFEVGKYAPKRERYFLIRGRRGSCRQDFITEHPFHYQVDGETGHITMEGDPYALAVKGFYEWLRGRREPYGWEWNRWAVEKIIQIKKVTTGE